MNDQEIRAQALAAAAASTAGRGASAKDLVGTAERLAEWIRTGQLPPPPRGTFE